MDYDLVYGSVTAVMMAVCAAYGGSLGRKWARERYEHQYRVAECLRKLDELRVEVERSIKASEILQRQAADAMSRANRVRRWM